MYKSLVTFGLLCFFSACIEKQAEENLYTESGLEIAKLEEDAPIEFDYKIIPPDSNLPAKVRALSGHWIGVWDDSIPSQLIIQKIDSTEADVLYSWGTHPDSVYEKGWSRFIAEIDLRGRIIYNNGVQFTFIFDPKKDILKGENEIRETRSKIIMERIK